MFIERPNIDYAHSDYRGGSPDIEAIPSVGDAVELFRNPNGLRPMDISFTRVWESLISDKVELSSELNVKELKQLEDSVEYTREKRTQDHNGPKVNVKKVSFYNSKLNIDAGLTDYFTLWGMPSIAPNLLTRKLEHLYKGEKSMIPYGAYVASTILLTGEDEPKLVTVVQQKSHGFYGGKISLIEEQMEPSDGTTFTTASRGIQEETGIYVPPEHSLLLGVCAQKSIAYVGFNHLVRSCISEQEFLNDCWVNRTDPSEGVVPLCIPLSKLDEFTGKDGVPLEVWKKYDQANGIKVEGNLSLHPTALWRINLLQEHLGIK